MESPAEVNTGTVIELLESIERESAALTESRTWRACLAKFKESSRACCVESTTASTAPEAFLLCRAA